jgi:hypothetical protein
MPEKQYRRLTRARSGSGFALISVTRSSLWLGSDHLLSVETTGYSEGYKRFYFRDIQAITIRQTKRHQVWTMILMILIGALGVIAALVHEPAAWWVLGSFAAFFAIPLIVNFARGPASICHLRTAVQTEELPSLSRVRRAQRILARLRPLIAEAQGQLATEEIPDRLRALNNPTHKTATAPDASAPVRFVSDDPNAPPRILS